MFLFTHVLSKTAFYHFNFFCLVTWSHPFFPIFDLLPKDSWLFAKGKITLKGRRFGFTDII